MSRLEVEARLNSEIKAKDRKIKELKAEIARLNCGWQKANHKALDQGLKLDRLESLLEKTFGY